jgi:DNA-binding HxlR family transcriptional regulator
MKRKSLGHMNCSIAQTLDVVGDPWTLLVVRDALFGTTRFDDFQRSMDIPRATLASRLDGLVEHGVMERRIYQERPERHDYVLTEKGRDLRRVLVSLLQWGDEWSTLPEPPVTLLDADTGAVIEPVYVDAASGRPLDGMRVTRRFNR